MEEKVKTETAPVMSTTQPTDTTPTKKRNAMPLIFVLLVLVLVGAVAAYFFLFDTPAKVKEKVKTSHPLFTSYTKIIGKIKGHLKEDAASDADSIERYGAKGEDLLDDAKDEKEKLTTEITDMKNGKLEKYKTALQSYVSKADELYTLEEDNVAFSKAYVEPLRKYEKLSINVSGASNYLYSDPDKYVSLLNQAVKDEESVINDLKKVDLKGDMGLMHDTFIATMQTEVTFLEDMVKAVENRDSSSIATATQRYTQSQQNNSKELKRVSDKLDNKVDDIGDELDTLKDKADSEYNSLKSEYSL